MLFQPSKNLPYERLLRLQNKLINKIFKFQINARKSVKIVHEFALIGLNRQESSAWNGREFTRPSASRVFPFPEYLEFCFRRN